MLLYFTFLEFILPILNDFNIMFQAAESMIGHLHEEMTRLLRKLLGKCFSTKVITSEPHITKVKFRLLENQHNDSILAVGWRAREFLSSNEDQAPEIAINFCRSAREFNCEVVGKIIDKFPFNDEVLQAMAYLNPDTKQKVSPNDLVKLDNRFLDLSQKEKEALEDEVQEYILSPSQELLHRGELSLKEY